MTRSILTGLAMALALPLTLPLTSSATAATAATAAEVVPARLSLAMLRAKFAKPGDRYLTVGGVELRYRDEGRGPVLLLLHGSRSTLNHWDGVVARLKDRYRIIRYDQPPQGLSGPLSDAAIRAIGSPEGLVLGVLDALKVPKATIVGVSSGGTAAYYFAGAHPERVAALVLSNTPSDPVPDLKVTNPPALDAALANVRRTGIEGRDFWSEYLRFLYGDPARLKPATIDYYYTINLREKEPNLTGLHALTANNAVTMRHLAAVKAPVLILWGMRDPVLTPASGQALYGYLGGAASRSFVALADVGHYPPLEVPERVAGLIDAYLRLGLNIGGDR